MINPFQKGKVFRHTGHIGDIIAFLPSYQRLGGTKLLIQDESWMAPMSGYKYNSLEPLLKSQGIDVCLNCSVGPIDYDMSPWRECYEDHVSLLDAQARYIGLVQRKTGHLEISEPWIKVDPDPLTKNRVIFNRTPRYRNHNFPWDKVLAHFGKQSLFCGTEQEHNEFCMEVGDIEYYPTKSCLEVAQAIQGAELFIGNQSSSFWIAAALRKPLIQEVFTPAPNSIIKYEGAWYSFKGELPF
jgi:hypothetical protein